MEKKPIDLMYIMVKDLKDEFKTLEKKVDEVKDALYKMNDIHNDRYAKKEQLRKLEKRVHDLESDEKDQVIINTKSKMFFAIFVGVGTILLSWLTYLGNKFLDSIVK